MSFDTRAVPSATDTIDVIRNAPPQTRYDVVLIGWQMDGLEAPMALRSLGMTDKPCLIIVTAHGREDVVKAARRAGIRMC